MATGSRRYPGYVSDSVTGSEDDRNMNSLESNNSVTDSPANNTHRMLDYDAASTSLGSMPVWESVLSSGAAISPPQHRKDILYRRHFTKEEFLKCRSILFQLLSCDEGEGHQHKPPTPETEEHLFVAKDVGRCGVPYHAPNPGMTGFPRLGLISRRHE